MNGIALNNDTTISGTLKVYGIANFHNGSPLDITYMQSGSLVIGGTNANYVGGFYTAGAWSGTNTAGLLMECLDNTEIVVHDANNRLASLMYYEGGSNNKITIGRNMGWTAISSVDFNGTVNIINTLQVAGNNINNYLFNNTGRNHATFTDFNAIDKFGYTFIQASTNGPGTDTQFYSWYIELGNEYQFANSVNGYYGMQFAIGRFETNPRLCVRRKENNVWTGWQGLTAAVLKGSCTINAGELLRSSDTSSQRLFFASDGTTYYQGFNSNGMYNHEFRNSAGTTTMGFE
jgi:hypothetical protein